MIPSPSNRIRMYELKEFAEVTKKLFGYNEFTFYDLVKTSLEYDFRRMRFLLRKGTFYGYFKMTGVQKVKNRNKLKTHNSYVYINKYRIIDKKGVDR